MSFELYVPMQSLVEFGCPKKVIDLAIESSRRVAKIVWDEDDIPEHCRGVIQWVSIS